MKRLSILLASLLMAVPCLMAQSSGIPFNRNTDFSLGRGPISFQAISYVGWGFHVPTNQMAQEQKKAVNSELFLNIVELRVHLYEQGHVTLGVDWDRDCYRLNNNYKWQPINGNEGVTIIHRGSERVRKSNLIVNTFSFPVGFEHKFGSWLLRADAALDFNLNATTRLKIESIEGEKIKSVVKGIPTRTLTCHFTAAVSYGGLGIYARFNPIPQFEEGIGPQYRAVTIGLILGLGM